MFYGLKPICKKVKETTEHIIDYLEGRLSSEEARSFQLQVEQDNDLKKKTEDIAFLLNTSEVLKQHKNIHIEENWNELSNRLKKDKFRHRLFNISRSVAAILLPPVLLFSILLQIKLNRQDALQVAQTEITSAWGTVSRVTLPDGSEVWLNSGSSLIYPQHFKKGKRVVRLSGEAYFKVASDLTNRFDVVMPDGLTVSAYGTEFNINSYHDEPQTDVTLAKGNIEIKNPKTGKKSEVQPGQSLLYDKRNGASSFSTADVYMKTSWKDGKIIFRRTNMDEVVRRLSRHFNVDIHLEGKELYDYQYSAMFTNETLYEILELLKKTAPIEYTITVPEQASDSSFSKKHVTISIAS